MSADSHDPGFEPVLKLAEPVLDAAAHPVRIAGGGEVRTGTASWTDPTMVAKGVFYPEGATTAEERLRYYATRFPVVEVDATYYALPREQQSKLWVERTPRDFVMDVKAHALMTGQPSEVKRLPKEIREALPEKLKEKARIYGKDLPAELYDEVWNTFKQGVEPLRAAGRLGAIFLQFPRWVFPSSEARDRIVDAKSRLGDMQLTVEFRHGSWFNEKNAERTLRFLTAALPDRSQDSVRRGRRAAGFQELCAAGRRGYVPGAGGVPVSRPSRGSLGEAEHPAERALSLPVRRGRAGGLGAADSRGRAQRQACARLDELKQYQA